MKQKFLDRAAEVGVVIDSQDDKEIIKTIVHVALDYLSKAMKDDEEMEYKADILLDLIDEYFTEEVSGNGAKTWMSMTIDEDDMKVYIKAMSDRAVNDTKFFSWYMDCVKGSPHKITKGNSRAGTIRLA